MDPVPAMVEPSNRVALFERAREAVLRLPDVADAAISHLTPVGGGGFTPAVEIATSAGRTRVDPNGDVFGNLISPGWFATFGTRLVGGRDFAASDRRGAPRVGIVNEAFARRYFGTASPLGSVLTVYPNTPRALSMEIVGIAEDAVYTSPRDPAPPTWYVPMAQFDVPEFPFSWARLSVRARTGSPLHLTKSVAAAVATVNPKVTLTFRPLADQIHASLIRERLMAQLAGFFGALALLLATLGQYGVTMYAVSSRRAELGIRLALGATPARVIALVLTRVTLLVGAGIVIGTAVSFWAAKFIAGLIHGLPPRDPATLAGAVLVLSAMGALAGWLPARRASRLDPSAVLRQI
jgi:putative ABC transport system permease protein